MPQHFDKIFSKCYGVIFCLYIMTLIFQLRNMKAGVRIMTFQQLNSALIVKVESDYIAMVFTGVMPLKKSSIEYLYYD